LSAVADESALHRCGAIEDATSRLECYDEVAKRASAPQQPVEAPKQPVESAPVKDKPETAKKVDEEGERDETFAATVTRCEEAYDGKYFFFFDNGQVWKQVKADRERYRDCDFNVTVTRDWFGYKMQRDGKKRRIRISRVK
jgi:hypothetical protein